VTDKQHLRLQGKNAIITGAGSGIGRQTSIRFVQEGAQVILADRNTEGMKQTLQLIQELGGDATPIQTDISKESQVQSMVNTARKNFGDINLLVNAAAVLIRTEEAHQVSQAEWDLIMNTNLKGTFLCCKQVIPSMINARSGSIVNISSMSGIRGSGYSLPYGVGKAGVIHLTTMLAQQYIGRGIRVNCVAPGLVDTPQSRGSTASTETFEDRVNHHPMGRPGDPKEIANLILFLASDEGSYISGETIVIDGGERASSK